MSSDLKPCPFCGDEAGPEIEGNEWATANTTYTIFCNGCHASAATEHTYDEAVARWNTRKVVGPSREEIAAIICPDADDGSHTAFLYWRIALDKADAILALLETKAVEISQ